MIVNKNINYNFLGESKNKHRGLLSRGKKLRQVNRINSKDNKVFLKDGSLRNLGIIDKEI